MKKNIGLIIVLVLIGSMLYTFLQNKEDSQQEITQVVDEVEVEQVMAPDFTLETVDGKRVTLSELKGKKIILNFWATWCPPCRIEMPHFQAYYDKYSEVDNVEILALNNTYSELGQKNVQDFVDSYELTFPILLMPEETVYDLYKVLTFPTTFFIDTKGRIQYKIAGPLDESTVRDYVKKLD